MCSDRSSLMQALIFASIVVVSTAGSPTPGTSEISSSAPTIPNTMMAGALTKRNWKLNPFNLTVNFEDIKYVEMKVPTLKKGEVLIKITAGAINPCEWKFPMGMESPLDWIPSYPLVLGRDCFGTVVAVNGAERLKLGDVVWANQGPFKQGCASEYAALKEQLVALAPSKLPAVDAAVMPTVSLTALDALRFTGAPWPTKNETTLLILGGSGGVGHVSIQLAKAMGAAKVIVTCGTDHVEFCKSVGADQVIDYHKEDWHDVLKPRSVHAVVDEVGLKGTGDKAYDVIMEGGFFVTLLPYSKPSRSAKSRRPDIHSLFSNTVYWHHEDLDFIRELVDSGKVKPHIDKTYTWKELVPAFKYLMEGHTTGKISIVPPNASPDATMVVV